MSEQSPPWIAGPPPPPPGGPDTGPAGAAPGGPAHGSRRPTHGSGGKHSGRSPLDGAVAAVRSGFDSVQRVSAWILGSAAIVVALAGAWLSSLLSAFRHDPGLPSQDRVLQLFSVGNITWGVIVLVAVALVSAGRRFDPDVAVATAGPSGHRLTRLMPTALFFAACSVGGSAVIDFLTELTDFGHGVDAALSGLVGYAAAIPLAAAAAWWAHQMHGSLSA